MLRNFWIQCHSHKANKSVGEKKLFLESSSLIFLMTDWIKMKVIFLSSMVPGNMQVTEVYLEPCQTSKIFTK